MPFYSGPMPRTRRGHHHDAVAFVDGVKVKKVGRRALYGKVSRLLHDKGGKLTTPVLSGRRASKPLEVVRRRGEEFVLVPRRDLEALYDTLELQQDPEALAALREHREQQARGESDAVSHEEALAMLRAAHPSE